MHIAIDLTPPIASRPSGMQALVKSYLRALLKTQPDHLDISLLVSPDSASVYTPFSSNLIHLQQTDEPANIAHTFDLIHYPFNTITFAPGSTRATVTIHDLIPEHFPEQFDPLVLKQMRYACKRAAQVITDSEFTRQDVITRYHVNPERVQCVYGIVDPAFNIPVSEEQKHQIREKYHLPERFLFYPAAARPHKNHAVLLDALQWIDPDISLVLTTGETHLPERFQQLKTEFPAERVLGLGHIEQPDLPIIYALAQAVVIPSLGEGFGYPALEALTIGTPLIHSNAMSLAEIIGDAGLVFNPYDSRDLAEKVKRVLEDQSLQQHMIKAGQERAATFNETQTADQLLLAYQNNHHALSIKQQERIQVAFDVWRLAYVNGRGLRPTGITTYVRAMYDLLHESDTVNLIPTIYPDPSDDQPYHLNRVIDDANLWYGRPVAPSWDTIDSLPRRLGRAGLETIIQRMPPQARGKYRLQQWKTKLEPHHHRIRPFDSGMPYQIYHSPVNALPPHELTDGSIRLLTVHDCAYIMFPEFWAGESTPPIQYALNSIDPNSDYVVCDSEASRQDVLKLVNIDPSRVFTIHLAADPLFNAPQTERAHALLATHGISSGQYVLMLAQPEPRKNLIRQVTAFHKLQLEEQFRGHKLVLISANDYTGKQLRDQLNQQNLSNNSVQIFTGIDSGLLSGLYAEASVFLYASLYEGFGIPVLEAMMSGCPVVTSPVSSLPEVGGDAVQYVDPKDPTAMADGLARVISDIALKRRLIEDGKAQASKFTWQHTLTKTIDLYHHLLEHN